MSIHARATAVSRRYCADRGARLFADVPAAALTPGALDQTGDGDPRPSPVAPSQPSAMAPGVRRSNSQIVGCSQDAAHPRPSPVALSSSQQASQAPDRGGCRRSGADAPAALDVHLTDEVMVILRLGASAAGVSMAEFTARAICRYADGLGLGALADAALALDPDMACHMGKPGQFRSGGP